MSEGGRRALKFVLRLLVSLALLTGALVFADGASLAGRFAALDPFWVAAALALTVPQYLLSAARWRLTAERLGARLPFGTALAEYYLAVFANQILPGGVVGDAVRALRHGRRLKVEDPNRAYGPAVRAVVYERAAGQAALFLVMLPGLAMWPYAYHGADAAVEIAAAALLIALVLAVMVAVVRSGPFARAAGFLSEAHRALVARDVLPRQAVYSLGIVATYLLCFYCAGRALGLQLSIIDTLALVPAVLFSMTIPITIGGWGIREAAAAGVWNLAGLAAADGVAISIAYGLLVLLSAAPGAAVALTGSGKNKVGDKR